MFYEEFYDTELVGAGQFKYVRYLKENFRTKDSYNE